MSRLSLVTGDRTRQRKHDHALGPTSGEVDRVDSMAEASRERARGHPERLHPSTGALLVGLLLLTYIYLRGGDVAMPKLLLTMSATF